MAYIFKTYISFQCNLIFNLSLMGSFLPYYYKQDYKKDYQHKYKNSKDARVDTMAY